MCSVALERGLVALIYLGQRGKYNESICLLFTPLFPKVVMERIRFERGPLKDVEDLVQIAKSGAVRDEFIQQMDELVYSD